MFEKPVIINSGHRKLVAISHEPDVRSDPLCPPVVLVVGGPQTRVGSHRQFVLLARALCSEGIPVLRFDYGGMGDSPGEAQSFLEAVQDLQVAIDYFINDQKSETVAVWGLCDAVSLALLYLDSTNDKRISHLIALNPWVRQVKSEAQVILKRYYLRRIMSKAFWKKVIGFDLNIAASLADFYRNIRKALGGDEKNSHLKEDSDNQVKKYDEGNYVAAMKNGLVNFNGKFNLVLSGNDLTADEFKMLIAQDNEWKGLLQQKLTSKLEIPEANHTFSTAAWRAQVERFSVNCLKH